MEDEHYLALGRADYAFQAVEWLTIWIAALLDDGDLDKHDSATFGVVVGRIEMRLKQDRAAGGAARSTLEEVIPLLNGANQQRQDVFHAHPVFSDRVVRRRPKSDEFLVIDIQRLNAAREYFEGVVIELREAWKPLWREAMGGD